MIEPKVCNSCDRSFTSEKDYLEGTSRWRICSRQSLWFNCTCGSTLILKKNKYPWYTTGLGLSRDAHSIFNQLSQAGQHLPYVDSSVAELQKVLQEDNIDIEQIAESLRKDPILLLDVMTLAKIHKETRGQDARDMTSITQAIAYIGLPAVSDLVMISFSKRLKTKTDIFNPDHFWAQSMDTAIISEYVCQKFAPYHDSLDAYVIGYLLNVGKIAQARFFSAEAEDISEDQKDPKLAKNWLTLESTHDIPSHTVLGEIVGAFWGMEIKVLEGIMRHHTTSFELSKKIEMYEVVAFANQMTHWARLEADQIDFRQLELLKSRFNLDSCGVESLGEDLGHLLNSNQNNHILQA